MNKSFLLLLFPFMLAAQGNQTTIHAVSLMNVQQQAPNSSLGNANIEMNNGNNPAPAQNNYKQVLNDDVIQVQAVNDNNNAININDDNNSEPVVQQMVNPVGNKVAESNKGFGNSINDDNSAALVQQKIDPGGNKVVESNQGFNFNMPEINFAFKKRSFSSSASLRRSSSGSIKRSFQKFCWKQKATYKRSKKS